MLKTCALIDEKLKKELNVDFFQVDSFQTLQTIFFDIVHHYGLANISYFCVEDLNSKITEPIVITTYPTEWQTIYRVNKFFRYAQLIPFCKRKFFRFA